MKLPRTLLRTLAASLALSAVAASTGCSNGDGAADPEVSFRPPPLVDLDRARIVDLSYPYDEDTLYWPTSPSSFELHSLHHGPTEAGYFYSAATFSTPEHGGTHMDAPIHFFEYGQTAAEVPLSRLIAPAVVIDVATAAEADPDYRLTPEEVQAWETAHGQVPRGAIVLLHTGWGARWPDRARYFGSDVPGDASDLHFPSYGPEAARLLVEERGAAVLGVDTASIDYGPSADFPVHRIAGAAGVPGLENVANLGELPATGAWLFALPMKIADGSGGPVRIAALVPEI